jgi:hypothetical protein
LKRRSPWWRRRRSASRCRARGRFPCRPAWWCRRARGRGRRSPREVRAIGADSPRIPSPSRPVRTVSRPWPSMPSMASTALPTSSSSVVSGLQEGQRLLAGPANSLWHCRTATSRSCPRSRTRIGRSTFGGWGRGDADGCLLVLVGCRHGRASSPAPTMARDLHYLSSNGGPSAPVGANSRGRSGPLTDPEQHPCPQPTAGDPGRAEQPGALQH